jgi:thioredoxin reductase (NADPH)
MHDIIIIGGGPAGLTAAVYARRAGKSVLVIEKATFGGQITYSPKVENIPGFVSLSGNEFAEKLVEQALEQGAEVEMAEVLSVKDHGATKTIVTDGDEFEAKAVIIATGARHRLLGLVVDVLGIQILYHDTDVATDKGNNRIQNGSAVLVNKLCEHCSSSFLTVQI